MLTLIGLNDPSTKSKERLERLIEELQPQIGAIGTSREFLGLYERELQKITRYISHTLRNLNISPKFTGYIKAFYEKYLLSPWHSCVDYFKNKLPIHFIDDPSYAKELINSALNRLHQQIESLIRNPPPEDQMNDLSTLDMEKCIEKVAEMSCSMESETIHNPDPLLILCSLAELRPIKSKYMAEKIVNISESNKDRRICCFLEPFQLYDDPHGETLYSRLHGRLDVLRRLVYDPLLDEVEKENERT